MTGTLPAGRRRDPSITSRAQRWMHKMGQVEMDIPVLKKFLFCFPLRAGLYLWGISVLFSITAITIQAVSKYAVQFSHWTNTLSFVQASVMYFITMVVILIEVTFGIMLLVGTKKGSIPTLTTVYRYYTVKMIIYVLLLVICNIVKHVAVSVGWFDRNIDPFHKFALYDSPQCGFAVFLLLMYMAIVIRSEVIQLRGDSQTVYHVPTPITTPMIPYHALPRYIDPKDMFKY